MKIDFPKGVDGIDNCVSLDWRAERELRMEIIGKRPPCLFAAMMGSDARRCRCPRFFAFCRPGMHGKDSKLYLIASLDLVVAYWRAHLSKLHDF